jgi:hypothetical protein
MPPASSPHALPTMVPTRCCVQDVTNRYTEYSHSSYTWPQVLPATHYVTSRRNGPVKLRKDENGLGSEEPISVPSLIQVWLTVLSTRVLIVLTEFLQFCIAPTVVPSCHVLVLQNYVPHCSYQTCPSRTFYSYSIGLLFITYRFQF